MDEGAFKGRHSIRLPGHDYTTAGAYFVTICAYRRELLFEDAATAGVIEHAWQKLPQHFPQVALDAFVIMPNHVHGIIWIRDAGGGEGVGAMHASPLRPWPAGSRPGSLGAIVGSFKAAATRELRVRNLQGRSPFWQRNFFDRVVRNEAELTRIREYVAANPLLWRYDHENPARNAEPAYDDAWSWLEQP